MRQVEARAAWAGETTLIVWLNEALKGAIQPGGKDFEALPVYSRHKDSISALVRVPHHVSELFAQDMDQLLTGKMTFDEALNSSDFRLMGKRQRQAAECQLFAFACQRQGSSLSISSAG
jgi:hypothetical protein